MSLALACGYLQLFSTALYALASTDAASPCARLDDSLWRDWKRESQPAENCSARSFADVASSAVVTSASRILDAFSRNVGQLFASTHPLKQALLELLRGDGMRGLGWLACCGCDGGAQRTADCEDVWWFVQSELCLCPLRELELYV